MWSRGLAGDNQFLTFDAESKSAKIPKSHYGGGGGGGGTAVGDDQFPTSDAESKSVKNPQVPLWWGQGVGDDQFPTFDAESKSAKIPKSHYGGRQGVGDDQFSTFDAEFKSAKTLKSHYGGAGGLVMTNFQHLMLGPNLLKSQSPITVGAGGGGGRAGYNQFPTSDAESKSAKILKSHYSGGGGGVVMTNFQLLIRSPNLLKSQSSIMVVGGGE